MIAPAQNDALSKPKQQSGMGYCYMFHKCAMKNQHIRTLFYKRFLNVGAAQLHGSAKAQVECYNYESCILA